MPRHTKSLAKRLFAQLFIGLSLSVSQFVLELWRLLGDNPALWSTHLGRYKMATIFQTTFKRICWTKIFEFRLTFHWIVFLVVQFTKVHHWTFIGADVILNIHFQIDIQDRYLEHFMWNYPLVNGTRTLWWLVKTCSGNDLVPSGNKRSPGPMLN